ncbi:DUF637 domain-containing protein [Variovorax boronicumulans]|uniref:DUF637 domain-containing protein n=1 Tax=Variovorax boronicumulans TaxID=436515 RepID=UPI001C561600
MPQKNASRDAGTSDSNTAAPTAIESKNGGVLLLGDQGAALRGVQVDAKKDVTVRGATVSVIDAVNEYTGSSQHYEKNLNLGTETWWRDPGTGINAKRTDTDAGQRTSLAGTSLNGANVNLLAVDKDGNKGTLTLGAITVNTPGKLTLEADQLVLATQTTKEDQSHTSAGRDLAWQKTQGKGSSDEQTHYAKLNAGEIATPVNSVQAGLGARDSVEALAQQPGMGWVKQLNEDPKLQGKVDWVKVEEAHKQWDYKQQGLTPEGAAIVTLVAAYFAVGPASAAGDAAAVAAGQGVVVEGAVFAAGSGVGAVVGGAVTAGLSALAGQISVALINNRGDLAATLHELGSSTNVKNLLTAIATGGVLGGLNLNPTGLPTVGGGTEQFMTQLGQNIQGAAAKALIDTAINGGSLEDNLKNSLKTAFIDTLAAQGTNSIGKNFPVGELSNYVAHAIAGCAVGAAKADSCAGCGSGAIGAVIGEAAALSYNAGRDVLTEGLKPDTVAFASMLGGIAAAAAGGDPNLGASAAANAAANNFNGAVARGVAACLEIALCRNGLLTAGMAVAISAEIERTRAENPGMSERAIETLAVSSILAQATVDGVRGAYDWFTGTPPVVVDPSAGGYGAGGTEPTTGPTFIPTPAQAGKEFGSPPLASPSALQEWLGNVLEGVPSDQAQVWAQDFIRTLPATQQKGLGDFIMLSVQGFVA